MATIHPGQSYMTVQLNENGVHDVEEQRGARVTKQLFKLIVVIALAVAGMGGVVVFKGEQKSIYNAIMLQATTTCTCVSPNFVSPGNGYSCFSPLMPSVRGYCAADQVCSSDTSFPESNVDTVCVVPSCTCITPNSTSPGNGFVCAGSVQTNYCAFSEVCSQTEFLYSNVGVACAPQSCECTSPFQTGPWHNGYTCEGMSGTQYCTNPSLACNSAASFLPGSSSNVCATPANSSFREFPDIAGKTGTCASALQGEGDMTTIAGSDFAGVQAWPSVNLEAYELISKCVSALGACVPENLTGNGDLRSSYANISGTPSVDLYLSRLTNAALMDQLMKIGQNATVQDDFKNAVAQLTQEMGMIKTVDAWFSMYSSLFLSLTQQLDLAFETMLVLLALPQSAEIQQPRKRRRWLHIVIDIFSAAATVMILLGTDGAATPLLGISAGASSSLLAAGVSMQSAMTLMSSLHGKKSAVVDSNSAQDQDNSEVLKYDYILELMQDLLSTTLSGVAAQSSIIVSNWGRLLSAVELAQSCPISMSLTEIVATANFPMLQWFALGVLMPSKYVIYWQRNYGSGTEPNCQAPSLAWSSQQTSMDISSQAHPAPVPAQTGVQPFEVGGMPTTTTTTAPPFTDGPLCTQAARSIWIGAINAPTTVPPDSFFEGLTGKLGPITSFVNPIFGQNWTGVNGGLGAFASQCQYMTKVWLGNSCVASPSSPECLSSKSSPPEYVSSAATYCSVYGILLPTYALADCNGQNCENAWMGTGNFNQLIYIPLQKWTWASNDVTMYKVGCCVPWAPWGFLQPGCDFAICDCTALAFQFGMDSDIQNGWWGSCPPVPANQLSLFGSTSSGCNWGKILESEGENCTTS